MSGSNNEYNNKPSIDEKKYRLASNWALFFIKELQKKLEPTVKLSSKETETQKTKAQN